MGAARVYEQIPRLAASILTGLSEVPVADAHEAMNRTGLLEPGIGPVCPGTRVCGQAITCLNYPNDNLAVHVGLHLAAPGDILVVAATSRPAFTCWGDLLTVSARARGVAGVVADGFIRDAASIRAARFPVWARGAHAQGAVKHDVAGVNVPVDCGGHIVRPGDVILADEDGVAVIPLELVAEVSRLARERGVKELRMAESLRGGVSTFELLELARVPGGDQASWNTSICPDASR